MEIIQQIQIIQNQDEEYDTLIVSLKDKINEIQKKNKQELKEIAIQIKDNLNKIQDNFYEEFPDIIGELALNLMDQLSYAVLKANQLKFSPIENLENPNNLGIHLLNLIAKNCKNYFGYGQILAEILEKCEFLDQKMVVIELIYKQLRVIQRKFEFLPTLLMQIRNVFLSSFKAITMPLLQNQNEEKIQDKKGYNCTFSQWILDLISRFMQELGKFTEIKNLKGVVQTQYLFQQAYEGGQVFQQYDYQNYQLRHILILFMLDILGILNNYKLQFLEGKHYFEEDLGKCFNKCENLFNSFLGDNLANLVLNSLEMYRAINLVDIQYINQENKAYSIFKFYNIEMMSQYVVKIFQKKELFQIYQIDYQINIGLSFLWIMYQFKNQKKNQIEILEKNGKLLVQFLGEKLELKKKKKIVIQEENQFEIDLKRIFACVLSFDSQNWGFLKNLLEILSLDLQKNVVGLLFNYQEILGAENLAQIEIYQQLITKKEVVQFIINQFSRQLQNQEFLFEQYKKLENLVQLLNKFQENCEYQDKSLNLNEIQEKMEVFLPQSLDLIQEYTYKLYSDLKYTVSYNLDDLEKIHLILNQCNDSLSEILKKNNDFK
ncbi:hypothetical protein PPERSA_08744 [Pseudocohnilembus persalinus]|uniref:Uncharacterized protein n=1 Tax=Pseudocohnilembus persalinus TaxID=266149 RepID=A0A0V0R7Z4_PSEPJ|nr:hypothetical protein PPERSA_08744 [Pseudocohnilembus persalinus]|eukprot:KRX10442.1 hypothetical protein PPERSA_08744 [Pseudocohnilembus persalinus]